MHLCAWLVLFYLIVGSLLAQVVSIFCVVFASSGGFGFVSVVMLSKNPMNVQKTEVSCPTFDKGVAFYWSMHFVTPYHSNHHSYVYIFLNRFKLGFICSTNSFHIHILLNAFMIANFIWPCIINLSPSCVWLWLQNFFLYQTKIIISNTHSV